MENMLEKLAYYVCEEVQKYFGDSIKYSDILNNISVVDEDDKLIVRIDPKVYDTNRKRKDGVIVRTGNESYVDAMNKKGEHKDFIEKCVEKAVNRWVGEIDG